MGLADSALGGVTVAFLAQVFRMDPSAVKRRLVNLRPIETRTRGRSQTQHLYDLADAAACLVDQKLNAAEVLKNLKKEDMPPALSGPFWDAQLKRQRFEENAGDLWRTSDIRAVLGTSFQTIKFTIQLWSDNIDRETGLTEEQRLLLQGLTDGLQKEIFETLLNNAKMKSTKSQIHEIPEMLGETTPEELDHESASLL